MRETARRGVLLFGGIGALLLAMVAGLLVWQYGPGSGQPGAAATKRELKPFRQAVEALAQAPGLRYEDTSLAGITQNEITVTAGGSQFGTTSSGNGEHGRDVLRVEGKTFTRWQVDPAPGPEAKAAAKPGAKIPSEWMTGLDDGSVLLDEALGRMPSPSALAVVLSEALDRAEKAPSAEASGHQQRLPAVGRTPALAVDTSAGRLLVSKQRPYRVLRLEPYDISEMADRFRSGEVPAEIPRVTTGPLASGKSEGMDLSPIAGAAIDAMFDTLLQYTRQLGDATDHGINFTLNGSGRMNCGVSGCTASQRFTGEVSSKARGRITRGEVSAVLSADFSVGGQPAGRCTSARGTFPVRGNQVSGSLTCSNPGAGAVYSSVAARYKAQAEAESRASGGRSVRYSIPLRANTLIDARALAAVEVTRLVARVSRERDSAECVRPHSFPPGTQVLLADGTHRAIEDIRVGDRVTATDPERGQTAARPVVDTITTDGDKDFTRLTVTTARGPATVTATGNHPFRLAGAKRWKDAKDLRPGDALRTSDGTDVQVREVRDRYGRQRTHDLTVDGFHTYYVLAGKTPVLVHNSNGCVNWASNSVKTWGHTFKTHGAGAKNTKALTDRARSTGNQQGQWLNNDAAAEFLKGLHVEGAGPRSVRIPDGLGQVIMPDGSIVQARAATIVPSPNGLYKTGFPIIGPN
ncbi:polymorphic toxin-type HINT domain-containing protein [Streptomyces sp. SCSIO 30461]|uniref:polymorphic toxin-type HINT domain-containing protein n=1 Tax=Streptomyces sp. SCSIO 30461 TaxID=3118085 RepID=UPI0030CC0E7E